MSNFSYGKHTDKHIGVWLRYNSNPDLVYNIKKTKLLRFSDRIYRVIVREYDIKSNQVWVEVWAASFIDDMRGKTRYNVFSVRLNVNPEWVCEGDLGSGVDFFN